MSPTSAFFAGDFGKLGRTRFKRWDGQSWAAGVFSNDDDTNQGRTLLIHWDGTSWTRLHDMH